MQSMRVKFVSKKISKIRWRPRSSTFVTGSWDDEENNICLWNYPSNDSNGATALDLDDSIEISEPRVVTTAPFTGGVTDLKVVPGDLLFASSSVGSVVIYKCSDQRIEKHFSWETMHHFAKRPAACTGISVKGSEVASVGEDGRLRIHNFNKNQQVRNIGSSDLCALTTVSYLRYFEVVIGNILGYLRLWDLRSSSDQPSCSLSVSGDYLGITSMSSHPTQPHILVSGHEDGTLCIWDLRKDRGPTAMLAGHSASVMEVLFHPSNPDYLYTCSMDGCILQWNSSTIRNSSSFLSDSGAAGNPWLNCDVSKHHLEIMSMFSQTTTCVNSLDFSNNTLIWGTDNEAVYYLSDINI